MVDLNCLKDHSSKGMENQKFSLKEITETILKMEVDLGLLRDESYGPHARLAWEASRFIFSEELQRQLGLTEEDHTSPLNFKRMKLPQLLRLAVNAIYDCTVKSPIFAPRGRDFLVFPFMRRKLASDGLYDDLYTDHFIPMLGEANTVMIEHPYSVSRLHFEPTRNSPVWYSDIIFIASEVIKRFWSNKKHDLKITEMALAVQSYLNKYFGVMLDSVGITRSRFVSLSARRLAFRWMLRLLKPKVIFLICSYGQEALLLAAKDLHIKTVEMQHGAISPFHLGYSVPPGETKLSFPHFLFLFGSFWKNTVNYPIIDEHLFSIGYPYFDEQRRSFSQIKKENNIVIISQQNIGVQLSLFAVELAKRIHGSRRVIYKLHPHEYAIWKDDYPLLYQSVKNGIIDIVDGDTPSLYQLLAEAKWQIGVNSTALFEGLAFGCITILADIPGIEYMQPLIDSGHVMVAKNASDIDFSENSYALKFNTVNFFNPNWSDAFRIAMEYIIKNEIKSYNKEDTREKYKAT